MRKLSELTAKQRQRIRGLLRAGRARIRKGWTTGTFVAEIKGKQCYCMLGGIGAINGPGYGFDVKPDTYMYARDVLETVIYKKTQGRYADVVSYNDLACKTKQDAIDAFTAAIELAA